MRQTACFDSIANSQDTVADPYEGVHLRRLRPGLVELLLGFRNFRFVRFVHLLAAAFEAIRFETVVQKSLKSPW